MYLLEVVFSVGGRLMARQGIVLVMLVTLGLAGANVGATLTVVNFDDLPSSYNGALPAGYGGINWIYNGSAGAWHMTAGSATGYPDPAYSGTKYVFNYSGDALAEPIAFSFVDSASQLVGAWFQAASSSPNKVRFNGYDAADQLIAQSAWLTLNDQWQYLAADFGTVATVKIERDTTGYAKFALDDLTYIPEPATLALLCLGTVGVAGLRRKRR